MLKNRSKTKFQLRVIKHEEGNGLFGNKRLEQIGLQYNLFSRDDREARMEKSREKIMSKEREAVKIGFSEVLGFRE